MNRPTFKRTAPLVVVSVALLYYSVAWAVLRCPHFDNPQAQEIAAYEAELAHQHANLDCAGPKYHTEFLAGPSTNSEVLRQTAIAFQEYLFFDCEDPVLKQIEDFSPSLRDGSSTPLPFAFRLPRHLALSVLRF